MSNPAAHKGRPAGKPSKHSRNAHDRPGGPRKDMRNVRAERRNSSVPKQDPRPAPTRRPFKDLVATAYECGHIHCDNARHFINSNGKVVPKTPAVILADMPSYKAATCACERKALTRAKSIPGTLQNDWVATGSNQKGVGRWDPSLPAKRVMPVRFRLDDKQKAFLEKRFPSWLFMSIDSGGHDHPIAHASTQVANFETRKNLRRGTASDPHRVLDLWGAPGVNLAANRAQPETQIDTICYPYSAKDYLRRHKWGDQTETIKDENGNDKIIRRYWECDLRSCGVGGQRANQGNGDEAPNLHDYSQFMSIHAAYYFKPDDLAEFMSKTRPGAQYTAVMHKFDLDSPGGHINGGEQSWKRETIAGEAFIEQKNVETGETYRHFDNSWMFRTSAYCHSEDETRIGEGDQVTPRCMTWSVNKVCEDTYVFTIVQIPYQAYTAHVGAGLSVKLDAPTLDEKSSEHIARTGEVAIVVGDTILHWDIPPSAMKIFNKARIRCARKARNAQQYADHVAFAKRDVMAEGCVLPAESFTSVCEAAFWIDAEDEVRASAQGWWGKSRLVTQTTRVAAGTSMHAQDTLVNAGLDAAAIALQGKETNFRAVAGAVLTSTRHYIAANKGGKNYGRI